MPHILASLLLKVMATETAVEMVAMGTEVAVAAGMAATTGMGIVAEPGTAGGAAIAVAGAAMAEAKAIKAAMGEHQMLIHPRILAAV